MKQIIYLILIAIPIMQSCISSESYKYSVEDAQIVINIDSAKLVSLKVGEVKYVPLETTDYCLIGNANKVLIENQRIYIGDFSKAMALFVFDINGKFIFKISKRGQGPGEYLSFRDFDIHSNGDIYMFDVFGEKLLLYDSEGSYLREIKFNYNFESFYLSNNNIFLSVLWNKGIDKKADLAVYDVTNDKTTYLLDDAKFLYNIPIKHCSYNFYQSPNSVYYSPKFSDIIYSIREDSLIPAIGINNLPLPSEDVIKNWLSEKNFDKRLDLITNSNYFLENVFIYETGEYISFDYEKGTITEKILLYNKRTKETHALWRSAYFMAVGCSRIMGSTENEFFSAFFIDPQNQFHKKILTSREELKNWQEEDNPVLVFFNLDMESPSPF